MTRVANLAQNKLIQSVIARTQNRIQVSQMRISTLQKSQDYAGLGNDANRVVTLESSRRRVVEFIRNNSLLQLRIGTMLNSIDAAKKTIQEVKNLLREILDDGSLPPGINKDNIATIKMSELEDFLNVRINGRYLFAGSKTDVKPIQPGSLNSAPNYTDGVTTFDTNAEPSFYYQGDDTTLSSRINESVTLNYGVKADDPGFEKAIRAIRILRSTSLTDPDAIAKFQQAFDLVNEAQARLEAVELNIGTKLEQLDTTNNQLEKTKNFADSIIADLEGADIYQAVALLLQDQTMLEASYKTMIRVSGLTLTKFL